MKCSERMRGFWKKCDWRIFEEILMFCEVFELRMRLELCIHFCIFCICHILELLQKFSLKIFKKFQNFYFSFMYEKITIEKIMKGKSFSSVKSSKKSVRTETSGDRNSWKFLLKIKRNILF